MIRAVMGRGELTKRYNGWLSCANLEWLCLECGAGELNNRFDVFC